MGPDANAPYGYMADESAPGGKRPKKRPGRQPKRTAAAPTQPTRPEPEPAPEVEGPRTSSTPEPAEPERTPLERTADRAPKAEKRTGRGRQKAALAVVGAPAPPRETIPFRAGPIAKGMNKFYRKLGKILRVANRPLGQAFIDITRKEDEDDITVGEAWEELARVNPRIRGVLMKVVAGGAIGGVFIAHLPILAAVLMLDPVARRFPLGKILLLLMLEDDEEDQDEEDGEFPSFPVGDLGGMFSGLSQADIAQAMAFAQQMGDQVGMRATGGMRRGGE